jgi:hypothetical protein
MPQRSIKYLSRMTDRLYEMDEEPKNASWIREMLERGN